MKDSKNLIIVMLCIVVCVMAVAYAAFSTTLNINGTATIQSNWGVRIENNTANCVFTSADGVDGAAGTYTNEAVACTTDSKMCASVTRNSDFSATVTMKFQQPGDTATCTIYYENYGSLDAVLTHTVKEASTSTTTGVNTIGSDAIGFTLTGVDGQTALGAKGKANARHTVTITGTYKSTVTSEPAAAEKEATLLIVSSAAQA